MGIWRALTRGEAETGPGQNDPYLAGRTYAIPFGQVWDAVVRLTAGGLKGWRMLRWDDEAGLVEAEVHGSILPMVADISVTVTLDQNAQTRVDLTARRRGRGGDLGMNRRRIRHFVRSLDQQLEAGADQILRPAGGDVSSAA